MVRRINYAVRKARGGKGLIPPNKKQWDAEHHGLDVRDALGLPLEEPLEPADAFTLLDTVTVVPHGEVPAADVYLEHFRGPGAGSWSGVAIQLPDGHELVLYNDSHPDTRIRATLMEEFFHLWLDHPRSVLRPLGVGGGNGRSHDSTVEFEAYASGAAALLPYQPLRARLDTGASVGAIASAFGVSSDLVEFRIKVTKQWRRRRRG
jgi:hypothetical protein